jgi:hypothetical protein
MKNTILFVLLLSVTQTICSQNLVENPGFEIWTKPDRPFGWQHAEKCLKDSSYVFSGDYSCLHGTGATRTSDLGQTIPVVPGKEYSLSLWFRTIITSTGNGARIWCYWKDSSGASLYDTATDTILRPPVYMQSDTWKKLTRKVTAPPGALFFYLEVRTYNNSLTYWDDIVFKESLPTLRAENHLYEPVLYPNPAYDNIIIDNSGDILHIDIHNITGTRLWSSDHNSEEQIIIPVINLTDGLYLVTIRFPTSMMTRKLIINTR